MRKILVIFTTALFALSVTGLAFFTVGYITEKYSPETRKEDFLVRDRVNLVFEGELVKGYGEPVLVDDEVLLPFDFIKDYIDETIFYDDQRAKLTITTPDKLIRIADEELEAFVNLEPFDLDVSSRHIGDTLYVPVMVFLELFKIDIQVIDEEHRVVIIDRWKNHRHEGHILNEDGAVRKGPSIKEPIYKEYDPLDNMVTVLETSSLWMKVRTREGIIGYVESRYMYTVIRSIRLEIDLVRELEKTPATVVLAWQYIQRVTPPADRMKAFAALNVLSPTWFTVINADGSIDSRADISYVNRATELGYQVWPLINNTFNDIEMTSAFLNDTDAREQVIRQLLAYAQLYGFQGINVDFENVYRSDKDVLTQFMRELRPLAGEMGLIISIDVGVPDGSDTYSLCYDHKALSEVSDYVMVMTYDQHWSSSPVAGSQAQLSWVENRLRRTLEFVESSKLVLGIPFYTRVWEVKDGRTRNIASITMDRGKELLEEKGATVSWENSSGQYYARYTQEGAVYHLWLEDERSVALKAGLAVKYGLAGVSIWELSQGNEQAWEAIAESLFGGD
ncbi:MAG: glycosyl hydrolase family 18 protein [Clostridia bacterium]